MFPGAGRQDGALALERQREMDGGSEENCFQWEKVLMEVIVVMVAQLHKLTKKH